MSNSLHAADLKVFALSEVRVAGSPRRLENLLKANRKSGTFKVRQSSRCRALVDAHVNRQTYDFFDEWLVTVSVPFESN